jgi:hypothetical protein
VGIIGNSLYPLGKVPGGGWSPAFAIQNAKNMPQSQMMICGFMIARLFGLSPF